MINEHVFLSNPGLVLVPYLTPFVPRYHEWMCDPALLAATESEPLSLEEEHENQLSWLRSTDKLTFILLAPADGHRSALAEDARVALSGSVGPRGMAFGEESAHGNTRTTPGAGQPSPWSFPGSIVTASDHTRAGESDASEAYGTKITPLLMRFSPITARPLFASALNTASSEDGAEWAAPDETKRPYVMIGDCNLFLLANESEEEKDGSLETVGWSTAVSAAPCKASSTNIGATAPATVVFPSHTFEVEVMVADADFRRRGLAELAVRMLMQYAIAVCGATRFVAKILDSNDSSIALFTQKLGFAAFKEVKVFHEIHYEREVKTEVQRQAFAAECATCSGADSASLFWCHPLTPEVASSFQVYQKLAAS